MTVNFYIYIYVLHWSEGVLKPPEHPPWLRHWHQNSKQFWASLMFWFVYIIYHWFLIKIIIIIAIIIITKIAIQSLWYQILWGGFRLDIVGQVPSNITPDLYTIRWEHVGWMWTRFELDFQGNSITQDIYTIIADLVGWMWYGFELDFMGKIPNSITHDLGTIIRTCLI